MLYCQNETKQNIENQYKTLTPCEQGIAAFFVQNGKRMDFSSKNVSKQLYVSEAALSRFAKKLGYRGWREFIYSYEKDLEYELADCGREQKSDAMVQRVKECYQLVLKETFRIYSSEQLSAVAEMLSSAARVFVYGIGSSGIAAEDFRQRFMRLGLYVDAVTDPHGMRVMAALAGPETLILGFSVSGETREVTDALHLAKRKGAKVVLLTANPDIAIREDCDRVIPVASLRNMDGGLRISPQVPLLVMTDVLHAYYLAEDSNRKLDNYADALAAIRECERGIAPL